MYLPQVCIQSYVPILNIDSSNDYILLSILVFTWPIYHRLAMR